MIQNLKNKIIKYAIILAIFLFLFGIIITITLLSSFLNIVSGVGSKQAEVVSTLNLEGEDPNVQIVKPNSIYSSEYLRLVRKYVFDSYKNSGKIKGYASLDKVVNNLKNGSSSMEDAYLKAVEETKNSNTLRPFSMPINMKESKNISSYWGQQRGSDYHYGWDISAAAKTDVYAPADGGVVVKATFPSKANVSSGTSSSACKNNNEIHIKYNFNGRDYLFLVAHLYPNSGKVRVGDTVKKGQKIGEVGTTGCSTGNHLHIEVRLDSNYKTTTDFFTYADLNTTFS